MYDEIPYESNAIKQTHPQHLYTIAKLYGLNPRPLEGATVLELGCASGGNLIPMAFRHQQTSFVGIDLSRIEIEEGVEQLKDLGIRNCQLQIRSILDFNTSEKFDYIICHGLYSWVSKEVRDKIGEIIQKNLTQEGIAYISYNVYPGWNIGNTVRDLMKWHTAAILDPIQKAQNARSLLQTLASHWKKERTPYQALLLNEIELVLAHPDSQMVHEHLGAINYPCYFYQFIEEAERYHLQYIDDAFLTAKHHKIIGIENTRIAQDQWADVLKNRRFRCSLLCHDKQIAEPKADFASECYIRLIRSQDLSPLSIQEKEVFVMLMENQHQSIHFNDLCRKIAEKNTLPYSKTEHYLIEEFNLIQKAFDGDIEISLYPSDYTIFLSDKPIACPFIRYQATRQDLITNRRHENIRLTPLAEVILPYLDGTHDLSFLVNIVSSYIKEGTLVLVDEQQQPFQDEDQSQKHIKRLCQRALSLLAEQAVFIADKS